MQDQPLKIETVHQCNRCLGCKTLHPLVSVIDLSKANKEQRSVKFGFYTILLIEGATQGLPYGRKYYDYSDATALFLAPGQSVRIDEPGTDFYKGWLLAFHPDLLRHTSLEENIKAYSFFFYKQREALHLSLREKAKAVECVCHIKEELQHAVDCHSKTIIARYIELLLDYGSRFYERQFITRCEANKSILRQTDRLLDDYILSGRLKDSGLPSAEYCAGMLRLSPAYFADLLRFETGKSIYEYFQFKRLEAAKSMLLEPDNTTGKVVEKLGYANVQYFSRLFKRLTGVAPNEYRHTRN